MEEPVTDANVNEAERLEPVDAPDPETLRGYTRLKLAIAAQLRTLMETLKKRASDSRFKRGEELMTKLAEDRFTLAVLGQFKRGKSSLMNAIIGRELLPVGVLPLTSAITVLKFGPAERLVIHREGWTFPEIVPVSALADYVTERGNPGNRKNVKTAAIEVPLPFLRRGLEFVDTPGVGSAIEANTATTYAFLPECDAAVFVTSAESPLTRVELEFLQAIREHARKIFFVVNKTDLFASQSERREVLDFIGRIVREQTDSEHARLFPISARLALEAKTRHDEEELSRSGLRELEASLVAFLSREKSSVFLAAIIDRAERLLDEETGEVDLYKQARELSESVRKQRLEEIQGRYQQQTVERNDQLARLRDHLVAEAIGRLAPELDAFITARRTAISQHIRRMLSRSGWMLAVDVSNRCGWKLLRGMRRRLGCWLTDKVERLGLDSDEPARTLWANIQSRLSGLPGIAAEAFELPARPADNVLQPWHLDVKIEAPLLRNFVWNPRMALLVRYAPSFIVRNLLRRRLDAECDRLLTAARESALGILAESVVAAINLLSGKVNLRAAEIEARIAAAVNGSRMPRLGPSQGMAPPENAGWGEPTLDSIREMLSFLRDEALRLAKPDESVPPAPQQPFVTAAEMAPDEVKPPKLRDTKTAIAQRLRTRGCPVCDYVGDVAFNFFAKTQYALYLDEKAQADFAEHRGFCPLHLWQLHAVSSATGESVALARLVEKTSRLLSQSSRAAEPQAAVLALMPEAGDCRACKFLREAEQDFIERFAAFLEASENRQLYTRTHGVCLRHLVALIAAIPSDETNRFLLAESARHFEETAEDMQNYAIKRAALRSPLANADEEDAAWRAVVHLAGSRRVCAPWPEDAEI